MIMPYIFQPVGGHRVSLRGTRKSHVGALPPGHDDGLGAQRELGLGAADRLCQCDPND
jgi:hypothetical protein